MVEKVDWVYAVWINQRQFDEFIDFVEKLRCVCLDELAGPQDGKLKTINPHMVFIMSSTSVSDSLDSLVSKR